MTALSMPASSSAAPNLRNSRLEATCESYGVDSRLLYNDIERLSKKRFDYAQRLVLWSRLLSVVSLLTAGATGLAVYYQRAQIYRVWRLRNPRKVQQLGQLTALSGGFSLCSVLFLISPVGFMRLHEKELQRTKQLDAIAVAALVQEQNFRTVAAWARTAADTRRLAPASSSSSSSSTVSPSPTIAAATETVGRGREGQGGIGPELQWVWSEVVLDPAQLLQPPFDCETQQKSVGTVNTVKPQPPPAGSAGAAAAAVTDADPDMLAAKKRLASQLLGNSEIFDNSTRGDSDAASAAEPLTWRQQSRRVWSRTADPMELQHLKDECVAMWEGLVAEKTSIVQQVL
ncbi:hypothetical protein MNV84_01586 [Leishmania braziliensis]|nr:hypothetical protein MNV84_01586 [Leishmania braziliensis]